MLIDAHYYIQAIYLLYIYGFRNQAYLLNSGNMELDAQLRLRGEKDCWEFITIEVLSKLQTILLNASYPIKKFSF